jgi:DNA-binding transcriptional regulator YiaG
MEIRALRLRLGLSQEKLAQLLGVSWGSVNRWEGERGFPSPMAKEKLEALKKKGEDAKT